VYNSVTDEFTDSTNPILKPTWLVALTTVQHYRADCEYAFRNVVTVHSKDHFPVPNNLFPKSGEN